MHKWLVVTCLAGLVLAGASVSAAEGRRLETEVLVYGSTPAGISAALAAGQSGRRVLLVEPTRRIGGLTTNGLSHTDFHSLAGITGTFRKFARRVETYYVKKYGRDSAQARLCFHGTHAEPHVNLLIWEQMLGEAPSIEVHKGLVLTAVETEATGEGTRIVSATLRDGDSDAVTVRARQWIDATYEGDLMAMAGVEYRVGREGRDVYNESLAPEASDGQVQGYNFRLVMTREPSNRVPPSAPAGYRRDEFLPLVELLEAGKFKSVFCYPSGGLYKAHEPPLPNGKHDINDVSRGLVRLSLPDANDAWPDGDAAVRQRIFDEHLRHNVGMLYFLQNDPAVPARFRDEAREWGWCRDEFIENGHLPEQLYVREARRMLGRYVFTEHDTDAASDDARSVWQKDAIAMGDYGPNCHGTAHEGSRFGGKHTGEFYKGVAPYQIPYGVLVPRRCENLLVPVACSASHVGFCALRLEPIWTSLGQAAGVAAHLALEQGRGVQEVPAVAVRRILHKRGAATIYVSDVLPEAPDFAAVQWWGAQGGLHGLSKPFAKPGQRGERIFSQYYQAFPGHAAELDRPLDAELKARWLALAADLELPRQELEDQTTRGDFIRRAAALARALPAGR